MKRVIVTNPMMGLIAMQVCAIKSATDKEILDVCNSKNPSGTTGGWMRVCRQKNDSPGDVVPIQCEEYEDRTHFIVVC